jgi:hypothetical protein
MAPGKFNEAVFPELRSAWKSYLETLDELRQRYDESEQFRLAPDQIGMAYRQLMEVQALAYNFAIGPRHAHPRMFRNTTWNTEFYAIGGNGPDFDYRVTFLDGRHTYRLSGTWNDCRFMIAQANFRMPGSEGSRCLANYDLSTFSQDDDGRFVIVVSATPHEGNWIALEPDEPYQWLMFRPTLESWDAIPPKMEIRRTSELAKHETELAEYSQEVVARRIRQAASLLRYFIGEWPLTFAPLTLEKAGGFNRYYELSTSEGGEVGSPAAQYLQFVFDVAEDEALILELEEQPDAPYWSFQLFDIWQHSLAMRTAQTSLHMSQISIDSDGKCRLVLCGTDPGYWNWLDSGSYRRGEVLWRTYNATRNVGHSIMRVKRADLGSILPADTRRCSPKERARELARREAAYILRYGE